jgi:hypothetical protein
MSVIDRGFVVAYFVFACILVIGGVLFRDSEAGVQASTAVAIVVGSVLLCVFDTREERGGRNNR